MSNLDELTPTNTLPLNAIRVFVEAARQLNFSRAARVLGMTQGGVSRHVATLERALGQILFVRAGTTVALTDKGRLYFDTVQEAMSTIELATRQMKQPSISSTRLIVRTSLPTFAMTTLIPALPTFQPARTIVVDVVTSLSPPNAQDSYDVLITRDLRLDNTEHWLLATEDLVCVCAPNRRQEFSIERIETLPILSAMSRPDALPSWANQMDISSRDMHVHASFDHYFMAIAACIGGMGYLVVPHMLVVEPLRQGLLVTTPGDAVRGNAVYSAYVNPHSTHTEASREFCRWLKRWLNV